MKKFTFIIISIFISNVSFSQTPTWSTSIAPIVYANCAPCHYPGGVGPFTVLEYDTVVWYAFSILAAVNSGQMPPWPADPDCMHHWDEKVLEQDEIDSINAWINEGNFILGDTTLAPPVPVYTQGTLLTEVNDTFMSDPYTVTSNDDEFWAYVFHTNYTDTMYVQAVDFVPGNPEIAHHVIYFYDPTDSSWVSDSLYPGPGVISGPQGGTSPYCQTISGWNPGRDPIVLPPNMGFAIPPGADISFSIHYAPGNMGAVDPGSALYFKFADLPDSEMRSVICERTCYWTPPSLTTPPFFLPKNQLTEEVEVSDSIDHDRSLLGVSPHAHLIAKSWEVYMVTLEDDTTTLLCIPQWYFDWQMSYFFTKLIKQPAGARIWTECIFDNTVNNPNNPNNPPKNINLGESTFDEMMGLHSWVLDYQPGDEDIILDSAFYGLPTGGGQPVMLDDLDLNIYPNPAEKMLHFVTWLPEHNVHWQFVNQIGMVVKSVDLNRVNKGVYTGDIDVSDLPAGFYFLRLQSGDKQNVKKIVVSH